MRRIVTMSLALAAALAGCGSDTTPAASTPPDGPSTFKVMTQNLYLGGDLDPAFAPSANLPAAVATIWASVQATDFRERAKVIAESIKAADPDLVALQEASLWRTQTPSDHSLVPNATTVAYDFLDILMGELALRGLAYRIVGTKTEGDVELPSTDGNDYRLTDRDAVLAKTSLPVVSASSGTYAHLGTVTLPSPLPGGQPIAVAVPRGWVSVDFRAGGKTIRLFDTHLEAFSEDVATQQASDLVGIANPAQQPTIILGDMNLRPGSAGYGTFVAAATGLADAWTRVPGPEPGLTCCWNPDLRGGAYDKRIDLVFATDQLRPTSAAKVDETERTSGGLAPGLAPSDHAGVVIGFEPTAAASTTIAQVTP